MKLLNFIIRIGEFVILLFLLLIAAFGVQWVLCVQTGDSSNGYTVWSVNETSVGYNDAFGYLGTSVKANYSTYGNSEYQTYTFVYDGENGKQVTADVRGPKYRCRNWIGWSWWKTYPGLWLDYAVDAVASVGAPIFLPTSNIYQLQHYYGKQLYEFEDEINEKSKKTYGDTGLTYYQVAIAKLTDAIDVNSDYTYDQWVDDYQVMYNYLFKIAKYNAVTTGVDEEGNEIQVKIYENYYNKFITEDGQLKTSIYLMYYTIILGIIVAIWGTKQFPRWAQVNDNGELELKGGNRPNNPRKKRHFFRHHHKHHEE